jgi:hypothetical protein
MRRVVLSLQLVWVWVAPGIVAAGETAEDGAPAGFAQEAVDDGTLLPISLSVAPARRGVAVSGLLWSTNGDAAVLDAYAEARVWRTLAIDAGVAGVLGDPMRPRVGASYLFATERSLGVSLRGAVHYKTEGFSEPEGEIELGLTGARHLGATLVAVGMAYGQDPEGNERDAELMAATSSPLARSWSAGAFARGRVSLGEKIENGKTLDALVGVQTTVAFGRVAFTAQAGAEGVDLEADDGMRWGAVVGGGLALAF